MRPELRLRHRKDFDAVFKGSRAWSNDLLVLRALNNGLPHNRYGLVTSKRLGRAVVRNKVRRRLRELLRRMPARPGWDVVIAARAPAAAASFVELERAVVDLLARARILGEESPSEKERA